LSAFRLADHVSDITRRGSKCPTVIIHDRRRRIDAFGDDVRFHRESYAKQFPVPSLALPTARETANPWTDKLEGLCSHPGWG